MWWILGIVGIIIIIYIIGIILVASSETIENVKFHDGGFLNLGFTTNDNREMTAHDVRKGLIWPITLIVFFITGCFYFLNEILRGFLLIFNLEYKNTKMYKTINKWFLGF